MTCRLSQPSTVDRFGGPGSQEAQSRAQGHVMVRAQGQNNGTEAGDQLALSF